MPSAITTGKRHHDLHCRILMRSTAAMTLACCALAFGPVSVAQEPVPTQPLDPQYSTAGVFLDSNGLPVYGVVNLAVTSWNGIELITGDFYDFETGAFEFMVVIPAAPATVVWFAGRSAGWVSAIGGGSEPTWGDNFGHLGTYVPI